MPLTRLTNIETQQAHEIQDIFDEIEDTIGLGDVVGPASSVNNRVAVFDGTTGKLIKDGGSTIADIIAGAGAVSSVFGRTGAVVAATNDYTWAQINKATSSLADITTRSAGDLSSGTLPDARFPATLPAISGVNLTNLNASNLASGTIPEARMPGLNGDVNSSAGTIATTIANDAVTLAKMANMATASFIGRNTAGTGDPEILSKATVKAMLGISGSDTPQNYGAFGDNASHTITSGDITANSGIWKGTYDVGTEWDVVGIQEMIYANWGGPNNATNPYKWIAGTSHQTKKIFIQGKFLINRDIDASHMISFYWEGASKLGSGLFATADVTLLKADSISYGVFDGLYFGTQATGTKALLELDYYDGNGVSDLRPQNITFYDCVIQGNNVGLIGVWISRSGGGAQGDNVRFYNCYANGFSHSAYCIGGNNTGVLAGSNYAYNAILIQFIGGDIQSCPQYGIATYGGSAIVRHMSFENGTTSQNSTGADMHFEGVQNVPIVEGIRSESYRFCQGTAHLMNCYTAGSPNVWGNETLAGVTLGVGTMMTGSPVAGNGKFYRVTVAGTSGGLNDTTATGGSLTTIVKSGAGWTTDAFVGYRVSILSGKGYLQYGIVTSNTSDTITLSAGWVTDYELFDRYPDFSLVAPDNTSHFCVEPNWGTQTTTGGATFALYDFNVLEGAFSNAGAFAIDNCSFIGGRIWASTLHVNTYPTGVIGGGWRNLSSTRSDFAVGVDDNFVDVDLENVYVIRLGANNRRVIWGLARNGGASNFSGVTHKQLGTRALVWSRGQYGGGSAYPDLWIAPGDSVSQTTADNDVLAYGGVFGRKTPNGIDQNGLHTEISGGYSTGSGTPGSIKLKVATQGSTGSTVRKGSDRLVIGDTKSSFGNKVGIGVADPLRQLDVLSTTEAQLRLTHTATTKYVDLLADSNGNLTVTPSGTLFSLVSTSRLQSSNYASQTTGWGITGTGDADFRRIYTDELVAKTFIADLEQALAGGQIISKSVAEIAADFTLPGEGSTDTVWFGESLPAGASDQGDDPFNWVTTNPTPYAGTYSHKSGNASGQHQSYFTGASTPFVWGTGYKVMVYVYLNASSPPTEIMLQFHENGASGWEHRAYWGANTLALGTDGTDSRRYIGALPSTGQWVRLEFNASVIGIEGLNIDGMALTLYDGQVSMDDFGKSIGTPSSGTLVVRDLPSAPNMAVFESGDIVRLRQFSRASGSLTIADAWGAVTAYSDNSDGTQNWTFTRSGSPNAGSATGTINANSLALDYGTTGNGFHEVNAIDGAYAVNSPYSQIVTWTSHPATGKVVRTRLGNLNGITGSTEYGLYAGDGAVEAANKFVRITNSNFEIHNIGLDLYEGTTKTISLNQATPYFAVGNPIPTSFNAASSNGIWMGNAGSSTYKLRIGTTDGGGALTAGLTWNGSTLSIIGSGTFSGSVTATTGYLGGWTIDATSISSSGIHLVSNATAANNKIYVGSGNYNNTDTAFYVDGAGKMSLKNKLVWDGSNLTIDGTLAANSVTARELAIGNFSNLAQDPGFERQLVWDQTQVAGGSIYSNVTNNHTGARGGQIQYVSGTASLEIVNQIRIDCFPGEVFYIEGWVYSASGAGGTGGVRMKWYNAAGTSLSDSDFTVTSATAAGVWTKVNGVVTAPASTSYCKPCFIVLNQTQYQWYVDDMYVRRGELAGWQLNSSSISSGGINLVASATAANNKIYIGTAPGTYNNTNTAFYVDGSGQMSLKDKFTWDGSALTITGNVNATSGSITGSLSMTGSGALSIASGGVVIDPSGIQIAAGSNNINKVRWLDGGNLLGELFLFNFTASEKIFLMKASSPGTGDTARATVQLEALAYGGYTSFLDLVSTDVSNYGYALMYGSGGASYRGLKISDNASPSAPGVSTILNLESTTGALLLPRMTTTERDAMTAANGMIIYNTSVPAFQFYLNGAWKTFTAV